MILKIILLANNDTRRPILLIFFINKRDANLFISFQKCEKSKQFLGHPVDLLLSLNHGEKTSEQSSVAA